MRPIGRLRSYQETRIETLAVVDDFGRRVGPSARPMLQHDLETVIQDLLDEYWNPVRVVNFNAAEGWSRDISANVRSSS